MNVPFFLPRQVEHVPVAGVGLGLVSVGSVMVSLCSLVDHVVVLLVLLLGQSVMGGSCLVTGRVSELASGEWCGWLCGKG